MIRSSENQQLAARAQELFEAVQLRIYQRTDRMFAALLLLQWVAAIGGALWLSPLTWSGETSAIHPHVWLALFFGGALCGLPVLLVWLMPGRTVTRYTISIAQVIFSSLLIHITGGRIETHFHVFGSLAFLAAYRDWKLLIPATIVVALDHLIRGAFWPETVFGVISASPLRSLEHAGWVIFEDVILMVTIRQSVMEMRKSAWQTAELEQHHARLQRTAEELNRAFEKERAIIEGALDAVIVMDLSGNIVSWNGQAERTFGWTAAEAIGQPLVTLVIPEQYRGAYLHGIETYRATRQGPVLNQRVELAALRRDGSTFPVEVAITPIQQGEGTAFCAFVRDITERKTSEARLRHAKEQAESANRAKSEFLANMSHEIRTPLGGILGFTEVLRRGVGSDDQRNSYLQTIHSSGQHLLTLINDILDLSKIESGRMEFEKTHTSPHQIISDVLSVLRVRAQAKGLRMDCEWTTPVPEVIFTDPARLRQLLMNLVGNAIKFTESGGVMIRAAVDLLPPEPRLIIEVHDTGIGIAESQFERIFQPFNQADNSITRRFGGTGLGLTISRQIAEGLGGDLTVESEQGRGTVFRMTIQTGSLEGVDFLEGPVSEAVIQPSDREISLPGTQDLNSLRVLLVEDGETNRDLISLILTEAEATVTTAVNGEEGVRIAGEKDFDLILMDMQMPVMDGYTATRKLRAQGCELPIIALTAHAMRGDREKCLAAGCTEYLTKPIDIDGLLRTVRRVTEGREPIASFVEADAPEEISEAIVSTLPTAHPKFARIVESFVNTLPGKLDAIVAAHERTDWNQVRELAHWLKGTGGTVGFDCFTEPAARLELAAKQHDETQAELSLEQLQHLAGRIAVSIPVEA